MFGNADNGFGMLLLICTLSASLVWTLAKDHGRLPVLFVWLAYAAEYNKTGLNQFHKVVLQGQTLVFITTAIVARVALV